MARISAIDEMGSVLAHELTQPLTAMMLYLQALASEIDRAGHAAAAADARLGDILRKATREAGRAGSIIQRVRQLAEKRAPERRRIDIDDVIDEALELALMGHRRRVRLDRQRAGHPAVVEADPVQVQQVVMNLARNALEAMAEIDLPVLKIRTQRQQTHVAVSIADTGRGIPPDRVETLFQAFNTPSGHGMGIGLTISRAIILNHMGELSVDAGGNGRGACFTFRLPVAAPAEDIMPRESASVMPYKAAAEQS
jgi:two-component system sensor kinase FixL